MIREDLANKLFFDEMLRQVSSEAAVNAHRSEQECAGERERESGPSVAGFSSSFIKDHE